VGLHGLHGRGIAIETEAREAAPKKVHEIPAVPAAGIENATPAIEAAPQQLIEEIDVDVAKQGLEFSAREREKTGHLPRRRGRCAET
jgi:hypothetical protein